MTAAEKTEDPSTERLVTPNGRLCASWCPQWRAQHNGAALGNCRLLAWHEVRAVGPYPESPEADLCPVLAIREAIIEPTHLPQIRCGRCQTWSHYDPGRNVFKCPACGAIAPGTPIRNGLLADVRWVPDAVPPPLHLPDVTPWAEDVASRIDACGRRLAAGRKVETVHSDTDGTMQAEFGPGIGPQGDGYAFRYPLAKPTPAQVDDGRRRIVAALRRRHLM